MSHRTVIQQVLRVEKPSYTPWSLRGMENLLMDFYLNPDFVKELLNTIADYNIARLRKACTWEIDAGVDRLNPFLFVHRMRSGQNPASFWPWAWKGDAYSAHPIRWRGIPVWRICLHL